MSSTVKACLQKKDVQPQQQPDAGGPANPGYATKDASTPFVAPYWHVGTTDQEKEANLITKLITVDVMGEKISIPCLTNPRVIKEGEYIRYYKPADKPQDVAKPSAATKPKPKKA